MRYSYRVKERRERKLGLVRLIRKLALFSLFLIMFYTLFLFMVGRPQLSESSLAQLSSLSSEKTFKLSFNRPVEKIRVYAEQLEQERLLYQANFSNPQREVSFVLKAKEAGLKDGEVKLKIEVSSGMLQSRTFQLSSLVDTTPPALNIVAHTIYVNRGGSAAIKVKLGEEGKAYVLQDGHRYELFPMSDGYHAGLFPIRLDSSGVFTLVAEDTAGNRTMRGLGLKVREVRFVEDRINLTDDFIQKAIYPLLGTDAGSMPPVEAFKKVNEVWRSRDVKRVEEIGKKTEPRVLWEGAFIQLPNSKVFATYGDIRLYFYGGQQVSESRHMGLDFASVERSPIPASNSGVVVFTGDIGIYGNTVIIDHGLGLMSLYGHLSEIGVKEGQFVKKGEVIGRTGKTGLALGDHLHFGVLVQGYEVNPVEWLDPKWINNSIITVLEAR